MNNLCLALGFSGALRLFGFVTDPWLDQKDIHRIAGEPDRVEAVSGPVDVANLKIVTWNIERGAQYDSVLAVLRRLDADVLLLQEVDRFCRRTGYRDVARDLAAALDMNWISAGEFQEMGEARTRKRPAITGQAILSRFPIEAAEVLRFKAQDKWRWSINPVQPRRGGRIALKARTAGLLLYNTHIESGGKETLQRKQVSEILADQAREAASHTPVIIGGDFNNGPVLRSSMFGYMSDAAFADALGSAEQRGPTSRGSSHPIDWIFVKNLTPVHGFVIDAKAASDHSPVLAALEAVPVLAGSR
jgi:endonuclease/exonuclease/phosphatase family metal-dependent hydrolase